MCRQKLQACLNAVVATARRHPSTPEDQHNAWSVAATVQLSLSQLCQSLLLHRGSAEVMALVQICREAVKPPNGGGGVGGSGDREAVVQHLLSFDCPTECDTGDGEDSVAGNANKRRRL